MKKTTKTAPWWKETVAEADHHNQKIHWDAYHALQREIDQAWQELKIHVAKHASPDILSANKNRLLLLLGECDYMARECMRQISK
jgi:predicted Zn-dependent protease with MMP-like domain